MATVVAKNTIQADISSETVVLTYLYTGDDPIYLVPRVDVDGIVGGAQYVLSVRISNDIMTPVSAVEVPSGQTTAVLMGRHPIAIESNEQVEIIVQGQSLDTDVVVTATLFDSTPVSAEDLNEILEQIQNLNIVAVKERVVLGPCQQGTTPTPIVCQPSLVTPSVTPAERTVQSVPQVIPQTPRLDD